MDDLREVIARGVATADKTAVDPFAAEADAALAAIKQAGFVVVPAETLRAAQGAMLQLVGEVRWLDRDALSPSTLTGVGAAKEANAMIEASNAPT